MKYYSKNPSEFHEYIEKQKQKGKETIRYGHKVLIGNIILLALFFILLFGLLFLMKTVSNSGSEHEFEMQGWNISLDCKNQSCDAIFTKQRVTAHEPTAVFWQQKKKNQPTKNFQVNLQKVENLDGKEILSSHFVMPTSLEKGDVIFINIQYDKENFAFRVYP